MGAEHRATEALKSAMAKLATTGKRGAVFTQLVDKCPTCFECLSFLDQLGQELSRRQLLGEARILYSHLAQLAAIRNHPVAALCAVKHLLRLSTPVTEELNGLIGRYALGAHGLVLGTLPPLTTCGLSAALFKAGEDFDHESLVDTVLEECSIDPGDASPGDQRGFSPLPLLSELHGEDFATLTHHLEITRVLPGQTLVERNQVSPGLWWFGQGAFAITTVEGARQVVDGTHLLIGLGGHRGVSSPVTITAMTPVEGLFLSNEQVLALTRSHGSIGAVFEVAEQRAGIHLAISQSVLFASLPRPLHSRVLSRTSGFRVRPAEILIKQGVSSPGMFLIVSGELQLSVTKTDRQVFLKTLKVGEVTGLLGLETGERSPLSVTAQAACQVLHLNREDLKSLLDEHPDLVRLVNKLKQEQATELLPYLS